MIFLWTLLTKPAFIKLFNFPFFMILNKKVRVQISTENLTGRLICSQHQMLHFSKIFEDVASLLVYFLRENSLFFCYVLDSVTRHQSVSQLTFRFKNCRAILEWVCDRLQMFFKFCGNLGSTNSAVKHVQKWLFFACYTVFLNFEFKKAARSLVISLSLSLSDRSISLFFVFFVYIFSFTVFIVLPMLQFGEVDSILISNHRKSAFLFSSRNIYLTTSLCTKSASTAFSSEDITERLVRPQKVLIISHQ